MTINISDKVCHEEGLVLFEYHAVLDGLLLVKVVPGSICALLAVSSVFQDPVAIFVFDSRLHFRDELIVNANVTVG